MRHPKDESKREMTTVYKAFCKSLNVNCFFMSEPAASDLCIRACIKGYLQNIVWHNWKRVVPLIRAGLQIQTPSFKQFDDALLKRHDIVHRSGHTKDGAEIAISKDEITELCGMITAFAAAINEAIGARDGGTAATPSTAP